MISNNRINRGLIQAIRKQHSYYITETIKLGHHIEHINNDHLFVKSADMGVFSVLGLMILTAVLTSAITWGATKVKYWWTGEKEPEERIKDIAEQVSTQKAETKRLTEEIRKKLTENPAEKQMAEVLERQLRSRQAKAFGFYQKARMHVGKTDPESVKEFITSTLRAHDLGWGIDKTVLDWMPYALRIAGANDDQIEAVMAKLSIPTHELVRIVPQMAAQGAALPVQTHGLIQGQEIPHHHVPVQPSQPQPQQIQQMQPQQHVQATVSREQPDRIQPQIAQQTNTSLGSPGFRFA